MVFGFDEDHTSILVSPQVTAQLHALLDRNDAAGPRGQLDVRLAYAGERPQGLPLLMLLPLDPPGTPVKAVLSTAAGGARVSALAPGRYEAGLLADGFAAQPQRQTVGIGGDGVATVSFHLRPQGSLSGYVGEDRARPAGSYLAAHAAPRIRGIHLRGAGVERTLVPQPEIGPAEAFARLLESRDLAWGSAFMFVDLPEGEYELMIDADRRPRHRSRHLVVPGRSGALQPIVLEP